MKQITLSVYTAYYGAAFYILSESLQNPPYFSPPTPPPMHNGFHETSTLSQRSLDVSSMDSSSATKRYVLLITKWLLTLGLYKYMYISVVILLACILFIGSGIRMYCDVFNIQSLF